MKSCSKPQADSQEEYLVSFGPIQKLHEPEPLRPQWVAASVLGCCGRF